LSIAYKEARETAYWIILLTRTKCLEDNLSESLLKDIEELKKIIAKILITTKKSKTL
jgi:four helix bundle protein